MDSAARYALQGAAAIAGGLAAKKLGYFSGLNYLKTAHSETGSPFIPEESNPILQKHKEQVGSTPEIRVSNRGKSGYKISDDAITLDKNTAAQFTLAHELGHRSIEAGGGPLQWVQRHTYGGINPNVMGLANIAIGAASPSMRRATTLALGLNYLNNSGRIVSEIEASRRGTDLLHAAGYPVSYAPALFQTTAYGIAPTATALAGVGAGRFLRSFASKLV